MLISAIEFVRYLFAPPRNVTSFIGQTDLLIKFVAAWIGAWLWFITTVLLMARSGSDSVLVWANKYIPSDTFDAVFVPLMVIFLCHLCASIAWEPEQYRIVYAVVITVMLVAVAVVLPANWLWGWIVVWIVNYLLRLPASLIRGNFSPRY